MSKNTEMHLVRYTRNANDLSTGALSFLDDERVDLKIGEVGYVTDEERGNAERYGIVLEPISEDEATSLGLTVPAKLQDLEEEAEAGDNLDGLSSEELKKIATDEGVDLTGRRSNEKIIEGIRAKRSQPEVGPDSLPATAVVNSPSASASVS